MLEGRTRQLIVASWVVLGILAIGSKADAPDSGEAGLPESLPAVSDSGTIPVSEPPAASTTQKPTTTTEAQTTTTEAPRAASLAFTGDVLVHSRVWRTAAVHGAEVGADYDFAPMFEPIAEVIDGVDWAVCHMEVNLAADDSRLSSYPVFRAPGTIASDLARVGYDSCSTASNHSLDGRVSATYETIEVLEASDLHHTGTARSAEESESSIWIEVNGISIAHLSYSYGFNGARVPSDQPWAANLIDQERILSDVAAARLSGAEVIILSLHWGEQYIHQPNSQQAALGPLLLASPDVDLIIGHHAHVVQPIELIDGEWLVYGLGNAVSNQLQLPRRDELLVTATLIEQPDNSFDIDLEVLPLHLDTETLTLWPSGPDLQTDEMSDQLVATLDASWLRTLAVLETGSGWDHFELVGGESIPR